MASVWARFRYLFTTTPGLIILATGLVGLVVAIWGTLSGPMVDWGVRDVTVRLLGMDLDPAERDGRLVTLYHTIAFAVMAVQVYLITASFQMPPEMRARINTTVTAGYTSAMVGGLGFGYFGHNWFLHGLFLVGMALMARGRCCWRWRCGLSAGSTTLRTGRGPTSARAQTRSALPSGC